MLCIESTLSNYSNKESDTCKGARLEQLIVTLVQAMELNKESIIACFASNRFATRKRKHAET